MEEGHFATHIRRMCKIYAERYETLMEASGQRLRGLMDVMPTETGFHTIGRLARGFTEQRVRAAAAAEGLSVSPVGSSCLQPLSTTGLVLGCSTIRSPETRGGSDTPARGLAQQQPQN